MRVLSVGHGADQIARQLWPDAEVDNTSLVPGKKRTDYDALISFHALNRVAVREALAAIKAWVECVKPGGEIQIHVPSLEWAAEEILAEKPSPVLAFHLFGMQGNQEQFYVSGWTMRDLRNLCEKAGIKVRHARTGSYFIGENECEMHLVMGVK